MLIRSAILEKIKTGEISLVFRKWRKVGVKAGGTQLTQIGQLGIDSVEKVGIDDITLQDAHNSGVVSLEELLENLRSDVREGDLYKIRLHYIGDDPRASPCEMTTTWPTNPWTRFSQNSRKLTPPVNEGHGRANIFN